MTDEDSPVQVPLAVPVPQPRRKHKTTVGNQAGYGTKFDIADYSCGGTD